jgi:uncharacterized membrane protein YidH (DUF202 family)
MEKSIAVIRNEPYHSYMSPEQESLGRRDDLARERTHLSNERTFLSYVRTAASFIVLGVAFIHFLTDTGSQTLGITTVLVGVGILSIGAWRFRDKHHKIKNH